VTARFRPSDSVRVRSAHPPGHVRTPSYCRGRIGTVVECLGLLSNPEALAYRLADVPRIPLYRVRFRIGDLWPEQDGSRNEVEIEIFEHWLEPLGPRAPR
jgi:hypothetical protein